MRSRDIAFRERHGEVIIVPAHGGVSANEDLLFAVRDSGKLIWSLLDGAHSVEQITNLLVARFDAPKDQVKKDVVAFLEELAARRLIVE